MKRKEREHLKEDPFANFIRSILDKFQELKKEITIVTGVLVAIALIIVVVLLIRTGSISKENLIFSSALEIRNSSSLTIDQKIEKLSSLKVKKGISSAISFYLASLHYEKGEFEKAKGELSGYKGSNLKLVDDQKKLLEAEILIALKRGKEGVDIFHKLLSDSKSEISKDFLLLRIAKINIQDGLKKSAMDNLNRILYEFPQSVFQREARELLSGLSK